MPIGVLLNFDDYSYVKNTLSQYSASLDTTKSIEIMKRIVESKIIGSNYVLEKYGFKSHTPELTIKSNDLKTARRNLMGIEGKMAEYYYNCIFQLFPEKIRPIRRIGYKAFDGTNNLFNFGYAILRYKIQIAILKANLSLISVTFIQHNSGNHP